MSAIVIHSTPAFTLDPTLGGPPVATLIAQGVDAQVVLAGVAQASVWWRAAPPLDGETLGVIGHFRASPSADAAAVAEVLVRACVELRNAGCTRAVGPLDGNTWRSYRFVTWRGDRPRFALEPDQPDVWPGWWVAAGFAAYEEYFSALVDDLAAHDARLDGAWARLQAAGISIRAVRRDDFEAELAHIFAVSEIAFRDNVLYTPLPRMDFAAMYAGAQQIVRPELCLVAERAGAPVGFVFAIPDFEQARRGAAVDTLVVKTLAVLPGREFAGLGKILLERCQQAGHALGFRAAIHALMHAGNTSRNLGGRAREIRRYTLFSRKLG